MLALMPLLAFCGVAMASVASRESLRRAPNIKLAVSPVCQPLGGSTVGDANVGLDLQSYETIVVLGDGYSSGGNNGNGYPLPAAIINGTNPMAGGRLSDGPLWIEYIAEQTGATLVDYAINGSVSEESLWPGVPNSQTLDNQVNNVAGQPNHYDPDTALYVIFIGMNDYTYALEDALTSRLNSAAEDILYDMIELNSSPILGKNFLVLDNYGRGNSSAIGNEYKLTLFQGLNSLRSYYDINVAFVDLATIWDGVLGSSPGYEAFGYTSPGACALNAETTVGACKDPETTFYWIPGFPSTQTHRIVADFVVEALSECT